MLTVRLSKELEERLERLACKANRPKSFYIKKALTQFLEEQEEIELATQAYREYLESGRKTVPFEEVMRENGLSDD